MSQLTGLNLLNTAFLLAPNTVWNAMELPPSTDDLEQLGNLRTELSDFLDSKTHDRNPIDLIMALLSQLLKVFGTRARSRQEPSSALVRRRGRRSVAALNDLYDALRATTTQNISSRIRPYLLVIPLVDALMDSQRLPDDVSPPLLDAFPSPSGWNVERSVIRALVAYRRASVNQATSLQTVCERLRDFLDERKAITAGDSPSTTSNEVAMLLYSNSIRYREKSKSTNMIASLLKIATVLRIWLQKDLTVPMREAWADEILSSLPDKNTLTRLKKQSEQSITTELLASAIFGPVVALAVSQVTPIGVDALLWESFGRPRLVAVAPKPLLHANRLIWRSILRLSIEGPKDLDATLGELLQQLEPLSKHPNIGEGDNLTRIFPQLEDTLDDESDQGSSDSEEGGALRQHTPMITDQTERSTPRQPSPASVQPLGKETSPANPSTPTSRNEPDASINSSAQLEQTLSRLSSINLMRTPEPQGGEPDFGIVQVATPLSVALGFASLDDQLGDLDIGNDSMDISEEDEPIRNEKADKQKGNAQDKEETTPPPTILSHDQDTELVNPTVVNMEQEEQRVDPVANYYLRLREPVNYREVPYPVLKKKDPTFKKKTGSTSSLGHKRHYSSDDDETSQPPAKQAREGHDLTGVDDLEDLTLDAALISHLSDKLKDIREPTQPLSLLQLLSDYRRTHTANLTPSKLRRSQEINQEPQHSKSSDVIPRTPGKNQVLSHQADDQIDRLNGCPYLHTRTAHGELSRSQVSFRVVQYDSGARRLALEDVSFVLPDPQQEPMRTDYSRMKTLCEQTAHRFEGSGPGATAEYCRVHYLSKDGFDLQDPEELLKKLSTGPLLVAGNPNKKLRTAHKILAHLGVDIHKRIQMKDTTQTPRIGRQGFEDLVDQAYSGSIHEMMLSKNGILNCLDLKTEIDMCRDTISELTDQYAARSMASILDVNTCERRWPPFVLFGQAGAWSSCHIDPEGAATVVHCISGRRLWAMLVEDSPIDLSARKALDEEALLQRQWAVVVLSAGDTLIMPPGTPHIVLTLENSIATGNTFYSRSTYSRTLHSLMQVHLRGATLTNSEYPGMQVELFRLVAYYAWIIRDHWGVIDGVHGLIAKDDSFLSELPKVNELLSLCALVKHSSKLAPQQLERHTPNRASRWPVGYVQDRFNAAKSVAALLQYLIQAYGPDGRQIVSSFTRLESQITEDGGNPNLRQRDLLTEFEKGEYFHTLLQERQIKGGKYVPDGFDAEWGSEGESTNSEGEKEKGDGESEVHSEMDAD